MPDQRSAIRNTFVVAFICVFYWACASPNGIVDIDGNHRERAEYYYKAKQYEKAKKELLIVLKENPDDVKSNFRLAVIYGKKGLINESRSAFEKVLSIDPEYSKAYFNLGVLYSNGESAEHIKKSIKYFETFLVLEPDAKQRQEIEKWKAIQISNLKKRQKK
jgi:tetratricopeptide (TPR) repeat protein